MRAEKRKPERRVGYRFTASSTAFKTRSNAWENRGDIVGPYPVPQAHERVVYYWTTPMFFEFCSRSTSTSDVAPVLRVVLDPNGL